MWAIFYQIMRLILVYMLPFFSAYVIIRRIEKRVKIRIALYFGIAIPLIALYGVIIGITYYPVPYFTSLFGVGSIILPISILFIFVFITKIKKQIVGEAAIQTAGDLLKLFLFMGVILFSLVALGYHNNLFANPDGLFYTAMLVSVLLSCFLTINLYIEIGLIYQRFLRRFWFLTLLGGIAYSVLLVTNLFEFAAVTSSGNIDVAPAYMEIQLVYGIPCSTIGGILATIPSIILYSKLRNKTLQTKILSGDLHTFLEEMSKLVGEVTVDILRMGITEYNLQFKRNIELTPELSIKNLRTGEDDSLAKYLVGVFSKRVGPIAYQIATKKTSLF